MKPTQKQTEPIEEVYKLVSGSPAIDAVSVAAKGGVPETDQEQRMRLMSPKDLLCRDVEEAYSNLFQSLAVILRR